MSSLTTAMSASIPCALKSPEPLEDPVHRLAPGRQRVRAARRPLLVVVGPHREHHTAHVAVGARPRRPADVLPHQRGVNVPSADVPTEDRVGVDVGCRRPPGGHPGAEGETGSRSAVVDVARSIEACRSGAASRDPAAPDRHVVDERGPRPTRVERTGGDRQIAAPRVGVDSEHDPQVAVGPALRVVVGGDVLAAQRERAAGVPADREHLLDRLVERDPLRQPAPVHVVHAVRVLHVQNVQRPVRGVDRVQVDRHAEIDQERVRWRPGSGVGNVVRRAGHRARHRHPSHDGRVVREPSSARGGRGVGQRGHRGAVRERQVERGPRGDQLHVAVEDLVHLRGVAREVFDGRKARAGLALELEHRLVVGVARDRIAVAEITVRA